MYELIPLQLTLLNVGSVLWMAPAMLDLVLAPALLTVASLAACAVSRPWKP